MDNKESVNLKIVRYSNTDKSELYCYDTEKIFAPPEAKLKGYATKDSCNTIGKIKLNQKLSSSRAKANIKRLIIENSLKYHCVTTYKDSEENRESTLKENYRDIVLSDNKLFLKRLSYNLKNKIKYVAVPEYHIDRFYKYGYKFLHMHVALSEAVGEKILWSSWNSFKCMSCDNYLTRFTDFKCYCKYFNGVTYVKYDDIDLFKIANYFAKYFSKYYENKNFCQRSFNQKRYLNSKGLKKPQIIDISISKNKFDNFIIPSCGYLKSMGLNNNIGTRAIIENDLLDLYLFGKKR